MTWVRERLRMAWVILEAWLSQWFTRDELLHAAGGLLIAVALIPSPWWWRALWVPLLVGYLREVAQGQAAGKPHPWNPWRWSNHRLREWAAWAVGGWLGLLLWGTYAGL